MKTMILALLILFSASWTSFILFTYPPDFDNTNYDVRIINGFSNNSSMPLVVWYASSDTGGIGGRALQERDDYSWSVESSVFWGGPSTIFVCIMKWGDRRKRFEAFRGRRDRYKCGARKQCLWLVKEDGFYFSNDGANWIKDFSWM